MLAGLVPTASKSLGSNSNRRYKQFQNCVINANFLIILGHFFSATQHRKEKFYYRKFAGIDNSLSVKVHRSVPLTFNFQLLPTSSIVKTPNDLFLETMHVWIGPRKSIQQRSYIISGYEDIKSRKAWFIIGLFIIAITKWNVSVLFPLPDWLLFFSGRLHTIFEREKIR